MSSPGNTPGPTNHRGEILLEKLLGEFKTFGEGLWFVRRRIERMEPKVNRMADDMAIIKLAIRRHMKDIGQLKRHAKKTDRRLAIVEAKFNR